MHLLILPWMHALMLVMIHRKSMCRMCWSVRWFLAQCRPLEAIHVVHHRRTMQRRCVMHGCIVIARCCVRHHGNGVHRDQNIGGHILCLPDAKMTVREDMVLHGCNSASDRCDDDVDGEGDQ